MEDLVSLTDLITRQKIHQAEVIDELDGTENKMSALYSGIVEGKIKSDLDAYEILYSGNQKKEGLKKLKERVFNRLVNSLFFLDQSGPNYNDIFNAGISCYKNYCAVKILMANRKRKIAVTIATRTLTISRKFEFTEINYLLTSLLTSHYGSNTLDEKRYQRFKEMKDYYFIAMSAENDAEDAYGRLGIAMSKSARGIDADELSEHSQLISEIRSRQNEITTIRFNLYAYLYQCNYYLETKEYLKMIVIAKEGLDFYSKRNIQSSDADYALQTRIGMGYFLMHDYSRAERYFHKNLIISDSKSSNYYSSYNYIFGIKINQKDYIEAYNVLSVVFQTKHLEKTLPLLVQLFKIKEAYIHFLVELGKIDPTKSAEKPLRKFRLNRFLNDVPTYSKDKRGVNISILIIQMILLVQNKKHGEILDKLDALNMYSHRYLRSDNTFRSNCFIKMLAKLPDADYHPIRWERYVKKFRDRLDEHPFELSYHNLDLEVIPFETLYDLVVEMLEKQKGIKR